mgnify:CR=1 FL=1
MSAEAAVDASLAPLWAVLEPLTDPEIPVVSLRELGILRDVRRGPDGVAEVVITPTYSGCPAMGQIEDDVRAALRDAGIEARVFTQLSPAWTTDWMGPDAREKLRAYGIAPPQGRATPATDTVVGKVPVGNHPAHVVVSPDGRWVYVTNGGDNTLSVVDTTSLKVVDTIPTGAYPHGIRLSPDGKQAYVANLKGGTVSVIDTESRKEISQIPVGKGPAQVGFTSDSRLAFVSLSQEASVAVIDPVSRKLIRKVRVGNVPIQLYATPDNRFLFVANQGSRKSPGNTVSVIDLSTFSTQRIRTGNGAHGVVVGHDGRHAYVTNLYANTVSVIDVRSRKSVATVAVGVGPNGISVSP